MTEIAKCPYCESDYVALKSLSFKTTHYVSCDHCYANGPEKTTPEAAIEAWNRVAGMRGALEEIRNSFHTRYAMPAEHMIEVYNITNQTLKGGD